MPKHSEDWPILRETRLRLGLTQRQMAERLNTPLVTYKGWETGRYKPPGVAIACCQMLRRELGARAVYDHDEIVRCYLAGESTVEIAKSLQCAVKTVQHALIKRGIALRPVRKMHDEQAVIACYLEGKTLQEVAEAFGVSPSGVQALLRRNHVSSRRSASTDA